MILAVAFAALCAGLSSAEAQSASDAQRGLHNSTWPAPLADLWRTSATVGGGLPESIDSASLTVASVALPPVPMFGIVYDDNTVFVLGGAPSLLGAFTDQYRGMGSIESVILSVLEKALDDEGSINPYVAKVDVATMNVEVLTLPRGPGRNYIGSFIAHQNGFLYAVAMSKLHEIDPISMEIKRSLDLPTADGRNFAVYNSLTVSPETGDLILKRADFTEKSPTELILVGVDDLKVIASAEIQAGANDDISVARLMVAAEDGVTYVYAPGRTQTLRFAVTTKGFERDAEWSAPYRTDDDGTQPSPAMVYMANRKSVAFVNNGTVKFKVKAPLSLVAQSTTKLPGSLVVEPVSDRAPGGVFPANSGDAFKTGITAALDQVNGIATGWQVGEGGTLDKLWVNDTLKLSAGSAIGVDQGQLYTDDRTCDRRGENCSLFFVVLDLATGKELARTEVAGTLPTIGHIFVGKDDVFYIATEAGRPMGFLTRISGQPD